MSTTSTERVRASAWQSWEQWCRLNGCEPLGARTALAEYLRWLVDPYGGALSAASANLAYWAIRSAQLKVGWRDPARDPAVILALTEIRLDDDLAKPRRSTRHFNRDEVAHLTATIGDSSPRGIRDRALVWLGFEGSLRAGQLTALRWRHVTFSEFDGSVKIIGRSNKGTRVITLHEEEDPSSLSRHGTKSGGGAVMSRYSCRSRGVRTGCRPLPCRLPMFHASWRSGHSNLGWAKRMEWR